MLGREGWTPPTLVLQASWVHGARVARSCFPHSCNWVPLSSLCALVEGWNDRRCSGWLLLYIGRRRTFDVSFWDGDGIVFVQSCLVTEVVWWKPCSTSRVWCGHYHHILLPLEQVPACMVLLCTAWLHMLLAYVRPLNRSWLASSNHHSNHIRTSHHTPFVFFSCTTLRTNRADTKRVAHW